MFRIWFLLILAFIATPVFAQTASVPDVIATDCSTVTVTDPAGHQAVLTSQVINSAIRTAQMDEAAANLRVVQDDYTLGLYMPPQQELAACKTNLTATSTALPAQATTQVTTNTSN